MSAIGPFSSARERRLWLWAALAVVAIYSTLGVVRPVADALRDRNLLRVSIGAVLVLVLAVPAWRWAGSRPGWREVGAVLGVVFTYWMIWVRISGVEERTHLIEYGVVGALVHMALLERSDNGRQVPLPAALAFVVTALLGFLDEIIQAILPERVFDFRDIFFNVVAAFMVIAARLALAPQQRPGWRVWFLWLSATAYGWGQGVYVGWDADGDPKMLEVVPLDLGAGYLGVVTGGALVGVLQWLVVRTHVAGAVRWVGASLGALAVVGVVVLGLGAIDPGLGWVLGVIAFGPTVGLLQWAVLRRQIPRAGWWMLAGTVGWLGGLPFGDIVGPPGLGAVYGAVTATALVWLLRRQQAAGEPATVR